MSQKILFCTSVFEEDVNSAGRHMLDLVREFDHRGFCCDVVASVGRSREHLPNTEVLSLGIGLRGKAKSLRLILEICTPIALYLKHIARSRQNYAMAVSFSPSIFWYLYVKLNRGRILGKKVLILRDIFPLWLADVGILAKTSITYRVLDYFCHKQLESYDVILVQNESDIELLRLNYKLDCDIDVLVNWYSPSPKMEVSDEIVKFCDNGSFTLAVVGNFGPAQDLERSGILLSSLLEEFRDLRILFIGQGKEAQRYFSDRFNLSCGRVRFEGKMSHDALMNALAYVDGGYFSLDEKNQQGHFPGKVLAYLMAGRPVFGTAGVDAPISEMLKSEDIGVVSHSSNRNEIFEDFAVFKSRAWSNDEIQKNAHKLYSSSTAFNKLVRYLDNV